MSHFLCRTRILNGRDRLIPKSIFWTHPVLTAALGSQPVRPAADKMSLYIPHTNVSAMAVKVPEHELPKLRLWLQERLPTSFKLYEDLKTHMKGKFPDLDFLVDSWPNPQAVTAFVDQSGHKLKRKGFYANMYLGVVSENDEALRKLLKDSGLVDWSKPTVFCAIAKPLWPVMTKLIREMVGPVEPYPANVLKATRDSLKQISLPEGLTVSPVTQDKVAIVNSTWNYCSEGTDMFIADLVRYHPSVYLTTQDGEHIGHMIGQSYGTMGMLYVQPQFRGQGYAKVIISLLAEKILEEREDVYVVVDDDNKTSQKLHESMGFQQVPGFQIAWLKTDPKGNDPTDRKCCI